MRIVHSPQSTALFGGLSASLAASMPMVHVVLGRVCLGGRCFGRENMLEQGGSLGCALCSRISVGVL